MWICFQEPLQETEFLENMYTVKYLTQCNFCQENIFKIYDDQDFPS